MILTTSSLTASIMPRRKATGLAPADTVRMPRFTMIYMWEEEDEERGVRRSEELEYGATRKDQERNGVVVEVQTRKSARGFQVYNMCVQDYKPTHCRPRITSLASISFKVKRREKTRTCVMSVEVVVPSPALESDLEATS